MGDHNVCIGLGVVVLAVLLLVYFMGRSEAEHLSYTYTADMSPEGVDLLKYHMQSDPRVSRAECFNNKMDEDPRLLQQLFRS